MALRSTKAAISLKRVHIEQKFLWGAYRNSPSLFRTVPSPSPYGFPFPKIGCSHPTQNSNRYYLRVAPFISGTGKATHFKFGQYIQSVHPNKSPLKILEKRESGRIQGLPKFVGYPLLSQEREKLQISNLASTFRGSVRCLLYTSPSPRD